MPICLNTQINGDLAFDHKDKKEDKQAENSY